MLIILITLSGILTIVMAVYGGILTSADPRHRKWFIRLGIIGTLLVCAQGYYLFQDDKAKSKELHNLEESVRNLHDQSITLMNAVRLQVTLDDFKHLEGDITTGFEHLQAVIKGQKPPKPSQESPTLPPAVVEHVRMVQRRAASNDPNAQYGLQVLFQTDVTIQPVAFRVDFDQEISSGDVFVVGEGNYAMKATAYSSDHKAFIFSFHSPAFTPNSSLIVSVQSKYDVRVTKVEKIQPLF